MNNDIEKEEEKDNKNEIQNGLNKKMDIEIDIDKENKEEEILNIKDNKYIIISCINCGNNIGLCDAFDNTKIILDYL